MSAIDYPYCVSHVPTKNRITTKGFRSDSGILCLNHRDKESLLLRSNNACHTSYRDLVDYDGWSDTQRSSIRNDLGTLYVYDMESASTKFENILGSEDLSEEEKERGRSLWRMVAGSWPKIIDMYCN